MVPQWKRYNLFISSTFKDMDYERDVIVSSVIPALNARYRNRCVELRAVDLRAGVNTVKLSEDESAQKVLSVCADGIDSARPFFIGLIGARYGWVPPVERWREFVASLPEDDRQLMQDTYGRSVTELEMVYGALTQRSLEQSHTLFYIRDDASYDAIPAEKRAQYFDTDPQLSAKLDALRQRVHTALSDLGGVDDRVTMYHLDWDYEAEELYSPHDALEQMFIDQISALIDEELAVGAADTKEWWKRERDAAKAYLSYYIGNTCTDLERFSLKPENLKLYAGKGAGLSSLLAYFWQQLRSETNDVCLTAVVGITSRSRTMRDILIRWTIEMETELGVELFDVERFLDSSVTSFGRVCDEFYWAVGQWKERGRRVSVLIDDVDQFAAFSPKDLAMSWVDYRINLVMMSDNRYCGESYAFGFLHYDFRVLDTELKGEELQMMIDYYSRKSHLELSGKFMRLIRKRPHSPRFVKSLFQLMREGLNSAAFEDIRARRGDPSKAIDDYLMELYEQVFSGMKKEEDREVLESSMVLQILLDIKGIDAGWWDDQLGMLACSPFGLTVADMENLLGDDWDAAEWMQVIHASRDCFIEDPVEKVWRRNCSRFTFGKDEENVFYTLAEYVIGQGSGHWLYPLQAYFILMSGDEDLWEESDRSVSVSSANLLLVEEWIADGRLEEFCDKLTYEDAEELVGNLRAALFPTGYADLQIDQTAFSHALDNVVEKMNLGFFDKRKVMAQLTKAPSNYDFPMVMQKAKKAMAQALDEVVEERFDDSIKVFSDGSDKVQRLRDAGKHYEAMRCQMELLCSLDFSEYRMRDKDGNLVNRMDEEFVLEGLTLWFISLCGAASKLLNSKKLMKGLDAQTIGRVEFLANDGYLTCYFRLCKVCPYNRLIAPLDAAIYTANLNFEFITTTTNVVDTVDELCTLLDKM